MSAKKSVKSKWRSHLIIPDGQVRPGVNLDHWTWVGRYIADKRPDVIVNIGDFGDMPSLSSFTVGRVEAEGCRYVDDVAATKQAMNKLMTPINKVPNYNPEKHFTIGNHEYRIEREAECNPKLLGKLKIDDLEYEKHGWIVHPFLEIATIDSIQYSHYFISGTMGRPVASAAALLRTRQRSATMGHVQRHDHATHPLTQNQALFVGTCYTHQEKYLTPQGNSARPGVWVKHEVHDEGLYDLMFVSLSFLKRRYS